VIYDVKGMLQVNILMGNYKKSFMNIKEKNLSSNKAL